MWKTLRTFYGFVLRRKYIFAISMVFVVISQILFNVTPYFLKLFTQEIPNLNYQKLLSLLITLTIVSLSAIICDIISFWVGDAVLFDSASFARQKIFKHVQSLDFSFHAGKSTGSLISAFKRGDSAFFTLFLEIHHRIFEVAISTSVMVYFFFGVDWRISILAVFSTLITIISAKFLISQNMKKRAIFNKEEDEVSGILTDNLINYETVKLFAKEAWEEKRLKEKFTSWIKTLWGYGNSFRAIDATVGLISNLSVFLIILVAIQKAVNLTLSVGDFVLITSFLSIFFGKLWNLVWGFRDIAKTYADIQTYFGLLDYKETVSDPKNPINPTKILGNIYFDHVAFGYADGDKNAIKKFDLKIKKGESIALVGKSGSGKTTVIKLLMRFYDPQKGKITIDNVNIKDMTKSTLRGFIGVVPQEPILFNNTIAYNIGYGKENATLGEIKAASALANIDEFIEALPKKYETQVGERGVKLSGGQKQRLAIARMILSNPKIIIFDEATSQLDSESERLIQDAFWKVSMAKTTIIIAHRLSTIMKADKIVIMEKGEIKELGTHSELLKNKDSLYKRFWDLQIKLDSY